MMGGGIWGGFAAEMCRLAGWECSSLRCNLAMSSLPPHLSLEMADELADGRMLKSCQMGSRGVENE